MGHVSHGTEYAYQQGCRCDPCRSFHSTYHAAWRRRARVRLAQGEVTVQHGTNYAYCTYGCRCRHCSEVRAAYVREYRSRRTA